MSDPLTISGKLPGGVEVDGVVHREFTLRLPTVRDNIEAVDEVGASNNLALSTAILTRQVIKLGTLKPAQIDYELITGLHPSDFNVLEAAAGDLEKKRRQQLPSAPPSSESASPSPGPA